MATIGRIPVKFGTDICVPLRMNYNDFGDPLSFALVSCMSMHEKLMTVPLMSAPRYNVRDAAGIVVYSHSRGRV